MINSQLKGSHEKYSSINPFNEEKLWPVSIATAEDLGEAVNAGNAAFGEWQHSSVEKRRRRCNEFADALLAQKDDWAEAISKEAGQPKELAESEVDAAHEWLTTIRMKAPSSELAVLYCTKKCASEY